MARKWTPLVVGAVLLVYGLACPAFAQEAAGGEPETRPLSVAVLNFETSGKQTASLGEDVPNLLTAFLSMDDNLQLVERAQIKKIVEEMALGKTGIVDPNQAAKIGYLVGARFIVTGRIFVAGDKLFVVSKVMSTETSKVSAQMVKASPAAELDEVAHVVRQGVRPFVEEGRIHAPQGAHPRGDHHTAQVEARRQEPSPLRRQDSRIARGPCDR